MFIYLFRLKDNELVVDGFSDPDLDPSIDDIQFWIPNYNSQPHDVDFSIARYTLSHFGDLFCFLLKLENRAKNENMNKGLILIEQLN